MQKEFDDLKKPIETPKQGIIGAGENSPRIFPWCP